MSGRFLQPARLNKGQDITSILCGVSRIQEVSTAGALECDISVKRYIHLLCKYKKDKDSGNACKLLGNIQTAGLSNHPLLGNLLVSTLAELGCVFDAQQVFDKLASKDHSSWNSLITSYIKYGKIQNGLTLYNSLLKNGDSISISVHTFVALLKACSKTRHLTQGVEIHSRVSKRGLTDDLFVGSALVDMYAKCGRVDKAQQIFDSLPVCDVVTWNSLIAGYIGHGNAEEAIQCFERMKMRHVSPSAVTLSCILKACGNTGTSAKGIEIHVDIERRELFQKDTVLGTSLVDMYAKCGLLNKAQEVFGTLHVRDVVSWNSIITGYAAHGYGQEALHYFEKMLNEGVSPNSVTFINGLKACGSIKTLEKGQEMHAEIIRKTLLLRDIHLGTALVDMYMKCGLMAKAQEVFNELPSQSVVSWNALISGYVSHGYGEEALEYFEQMQRKGISPNAVSYICILKACNLTGSVLKGEEIHSEIEKQTFLQNDIAVGTTLVDMYARFGMLTNAKKVFDNLPVRNITSWNSLMYGYAENGCEDEVLKCYEKIQSEGIHPNAFTYVCCLKACTSKRALEQGQEIHFEIERHYLLEKDIMLGSVLIDMYAKCGLLAMSQEVFDKLLVRDVVSWNSLINGYTDHGKSEEAYSCYEQMKLEGVTPDTVTLIGTLKACGCKGAGYMAVKIHHDAERMGLLDEDHLAVTALIYTYAKCGLLTKAQEVFDNIPVRYVELWNTLIGGYLNDGNAEDALECFEQMKREGISPDAVTYLCGLKACGFIEDIEKAKVTHIEIGINSEMAGDTVIGTALVDMYLKCDSVELAQQVFDNLPYRDIVSWNSLIGGYAEHDHGEEALAYFEKMQSDGVKPNSITFSSLLKTCTSIGATDKGQEIHAEIERLGLLEKDTVLGTNLVDLYSKCGMKLLSHEVFEKLVDRDAMSWNSLIAACTELGDIESVFHVFSRMIQEGIEPDPVSFNIVFSACSRAGLFNQSQTFFDIMTRKYGIIPTSEHHSCIVNLLCRAGNFEAAVALIKQMPPCPDSVTWRTVLDACVNLGNTNLGKQAFQNAIKLENDSASYVLMSNMFAGS